MSEKAGMGKSKTINVYIENNNNVNEPAVTVTINSDATVFDLTKNVAKSFLEFNKKNNGYYKEFRLVWNHQLLNTSEFQNQKIDLLEKPITNGKTIGINFYSSIGKDVFSWNTLSEKDKEEAEKIVSVSEISPEVDLQEQTTINLNTDKKEQNPNSERTKEKEEEKSVGHKSSWPTPRIIVGVIDLLLLVVAVATFLLNIHIVATTVLAALFVVGAILFFGWNTILPKTLLDNCLKKPNLENILGEKNKDKIEEIGNNEKTNPEEEYKGEKKEEEEYNLL